MRNVVVWFQIFSRPPAQVGRFVMLEWLLLLSFTFGCSVGATVVWFFVWGRAAVIRTLRCDDVFICSSRAKCFHLSDQCGHLPLIRFYGHLRSHVHTTCFA